MQPWGEVYAIPGANTLFEGRHIKRGERDIRDTEIRTQIEESYQRETEEGSKTQIKEHESSRCKEEPGPLRDTASEGHSTL
jgi:hypothetical protein